jgi:hypothetical protein
MPLTIELPRARRREAPLISENAAPLAEPRLGYNFRLNATQSA